MADSLVQKANARQKALLGREQVRIQKTLNAYKLVYADLNREIKSLVQEMQIAEAKGETIDTDWIKKRDRLESLRKQTIATMSRFGGELEALLQSEVKLEAQKGADAMVETTADAGIAFDRLPTEAVQAIVDQTISDPRLRRAIDRMGPDTWQKVEAEVIGGLGAGRAPAEVGRRITEATGLPIARGLMLARTIPINANREAAHQSRLRNAEILEGWVWFTSKKDSVCPYCRSNHGQLYPLTQRQSSHPNCACTSLPQIPGMEDEIAEDMKLYGPKSPAERIKEIEEKLRDPNLSNAYKYKLRKELEQLRGGVQPPKPAPIPKPRPEPEPTVEDTPERRKLIERKKLLEEKLKAGAALSSTYKYKLRKELDQINAQLGSMPAPAAPAPKPAPKPSRVTGADIRRKMEEVAKEYAHSDEESNYLSDEHAMLIKGASKNPKSLSWRRIAELSDKYHEEASPSFQRIMRSILQVDAEDETARISPLESAENAERFERGWREFNRLVGRKTLSKIPTRRPQIKSMHGRAYYEYESNSVNVASDDDESVIVHELGHWLEMTLPHAKNAAFNFWKRRTQTSQWTKLADMFPLHGYGPNEYAKPNAFMSPYMGKVYSNVGRDSGGRPIVDDEDELYASEIISMGLEEMWRNPLHFARVDPDYFDFIWDLIRED